MSKDIIFPKRIDLLTIRPISELFSEQVNKFTSESLRAKVTGSLNPSLALDVLKKKEGRKVIAVDLGGDKLIAVTLKVRDGLLIQDPGNTVSAQSSSEADYLSILEDIAREASSEGLSVGISVAGPVEGAKSLASPNLMKFSNSFKEKYDSDFAKLFPTLGTVSNDMVACIVAGAIEAKKQFPQADKVLLIGNGSGFGGAILKDGQIIAIEPGHVELISSLNPYAQDKHCGLFGAQFVCTEGVAASKAGVESLWAKNKGARLSGRQINERYMQGDPLAADLYDNSALIVAHAIRGVSNIFQLLKESGDTIIIGHGGIFNVNGYGERVGQILKKDLGFNPKLLFTKNFSTNACLEGAALATLVKL